MHSWRWIWIWLSVTAAGCGRVDTWLGKGTLELYPVVVEGESGDRRCRDYNGTCVVLAAQPTVRIDAPRFKVVAGDKPAISISLSPTQQRAMGDAPGKLAVVVDGQVLHVARLRSKPGDALMLSFCNRANFARVVHALDPRS